MEERFNAASTTDSLADIAAALGEPVPEEKPVAAAPKAEVKADPVAADPDPNADPGDEPEPGGEEEPSPEPQKASAPQRRRGKPGAEERISQLTAENRKRLFNETILAEEKARLAEENAALKQRLESAAKPAAAAAEPAEAPKPTADPARPKQEDYENYEDFVEALTDYKVERRIAQERAASAAAAERYQREQEQAIFEDSLDQAAAVYEDFHDVLERGKDLPVTEPMKDAIKTSPLAGHLMYFLNRNADLCVKLARMRPSVAVKEIGKIESAIARASRPPAPKDAAPAEKTAETPQRQVSRAPAPPPSVRSGGGNTGLPKDLRQITTLADWEAAREAQGGGR